MCLCLVCILAFLPQACRSISVLMCIQMNNFCFDQLCLASMLSFLSCACLFSMPSIHGWECFPFFSLLLSHSFLLFSFFCQSRTFTHTGIYARMYERRQAQTHKQTNKDTTYTRTHTDTHVPTHIQSFVKVCWNTWNEYWISNALSANVYLYFQSWKLYPIMSCIFMTGDWPCPAEFLKYFGTKGVRPAKTLLILNLYDNIRSLGNGASARGVLTNLNFMIKQEIICPWCFCYQLFYPPFCFFLSFFFLNICCC